MNSRSKKYIDARKAGKGDKKGSATKAGYDKPNEKTKNQVKSGSKEVSATQDDTGGGNDSGKRSDDN
jgi:hypothetical protein